MNAPRSEIEMWLESHRVTLAAPVAASDIVGIGYVMDEVDSLIGRLRNPELMASLGAELPRGVLFHGAPGTGKTPWRATSRGGLALYRCSMSAPTS